MRVWCGCGVCRTAISSSRWIGVVQWSACNRGRGPLLKTNRSCRWQSRRRPIIIDGCIMWLMADATVSWCLLSPIIARICLAERKQSNWGPRLRPCVGNKCLHEVRTERRGVHHGGYEWDCAVCYCYRMCLARAALFQPLEKRNVGPSTNFGGRYFSWKIELALEEMLP